MTKSEASLDDLLFLGLREEVVGLVGDESLDDVSMASFTRNQKGRESIVVLWLKMSPSFDEDEDEGMMAMLTGDDERGCGSSLRVEEGPMIEEDLDDLRVS